MVEVRIRGFRATDRFWQENVLRELCPLLELGKVSPGIKNEPFKVF